MFCKQVGLRYGRFRMAFQGSSGNVGQYYVGEQGDIGLIICYIANRPDDLKKYHLTPTLNRGLQRYIADSNSALLGYEHQLLTS